MILFGGLAVFGLITTLSTIPEFVVTRKNLTDQTRIFKSWTYILASEIIVLASSIYFLIDGFYRMKRAIQKD